MVIPFLSDQAGKDDRSTCYWTCFCDCVHLCPLWDEHMHHCPHGEMDECRGVDPNTH